MKIFNSMMIGTLLLTCPLCAEGIGFNIGPFSMQFNVDGTSYADDHKDILDSPICYAISNQKQLDMIVEGKEKINSKELKFVTKRLVIEPYAFGLTQDGKPVLQGNVIKETLIKEVSVKYGEDKFGNSTSWSDSSKEGGFFSGWFRSDKNQNIDIEKISNIHVVSESHFEAPKDYKGLKDENIRVICQLPVKS